MLRKIKATKVGSYLLMSEASWKAYGVEYKALHIKTKEVFAIKAFDKSKLEAYEKMISELKDFNNNNFLILKEFLDSPTHRYVVVEWVSRDCSLAQLEETHDKRPSFSDETQLMQIREAIEVLSEKKIYLANLSPHHVYLDSKRKLRVDAIEAAIPSQRPSFSPVEASGSPEDDHQLKSKAALASFEVLVKFMIFGKYPFMGNNEKEIYEKIKNHSGAGLDAYCSNRPSSESPCTKTSSNASTDISPRSRLLSSTEALEFWRNQTRLHGQPITVEQPTAAPMVEMQFRKKQDEPSSQHVSRLNDTPLNANDSSIDRPAVVLNLKRTASTTKEFATIVLQNCRAVFAAFRAPLEPRERSICTHTGICYLLALKKTQLMVSSLHLQLLADKTLQRLSGAYYRTIDQYISELKELATEVSSELALRLRDLRSAVELDGCSGGLVKAVLLNPHCLQETVNMDCRRELRLLVGKIGSPSNARLTKQTEQAVCILHELLHFKVLRAASGQSMDWVRLDRKLRDADFRLQRLEYVVTANL